MEFSGISWTHGTFNTVWGCSEVSPACDNCYARTFALSKGFDVWNNGGERRLLSDSYWREPLKWNRKAEKAGRRMRVFCGSMCDWAERHPVVASVRPRLHELIKATPNIDWLLLSKRFDNIEKCLPWKAGEEPWPNVWVGTTAEDQKWTDVRLGYLKKSGFFERMRPKVFFVSAEPLLGPVDFEPYADIIDWLIVGGESGAKARPMSPVWVQSALDTAVRHKIPFHFKQWGEWLPVAAPHYRPKMVEGIATQELDFTKPYRHVIMNAEGEVREATPGDVMTSRDWAFAKVGKELAGHYLIGFGHGKVEYHEVPFEGVAA